MLLDVLHGILYSKGIRLGIPGGWGRLTVAMMGGHTDIVPFQCPQIHDHAMTVARVPARKYYWDVDLNLDTQLAVSQWYGFDMDSAYVDVYNYEVEALGAKMIYSDNAMPTVDSSDPLIKTPADLDRIGPLDASKGRIPMSIEWGKKLIKKLPGIPLRGNFTSHWSLICQAIGYQKAIRAVKRDKGYGKALFDWANDQVLFPYMQAYAKEGFKAGAGVDAWAAYPVVSFDIIDEWILPYAKSFSGRCKKELKMNVLAAAGAGDYCEEDPAKFDKATLFKCLDYTCETAGAKMAFIAMGRTQDWDMHWVVEYAYARGKNGKKVPIMTSLNGRYLRDSTPEEITRKVGEWIDLMGREGGLIFYVGSIPADTPPINVHTAIHAVHTLGKYPIAADLSAVKVEPPQFRPFDEWLNGRPEEDLILQARAWEPEREKVLA